VPSPPRILIAKTGTTERLVVQRHGDYDDWFIAALDAGGATSAVVEAHRGAALPSLAGFDGVILTGSPLSVRDEAPWMADLGAWALRAADRLPVLAVCFGHQLVGEALGGRVAPNPRGGEYGTIEVALTDAGVSHPLFSGLGERPSVQSTHRDVLVTPPSASGVVLLGSTPNTRWQAFGWGPRLHAVQFHPELPAAALADLMAVRGIAGSPRATADGARILSNWLGIVRGS